MYSISNLGCASITGAVGFAAALIFGGEIATLFGKVCNTHLKEIAPKNPESSAVIVLDIIKRHLQLALEEGGKINCGHCLRQPDNYEQNISAATVRYCKEALTWSRGTPEDVLWYSHTSCLEVGEINYNKGRLQRICYFPEEMIPPCTSCCKSSGRNTTD